jgi:hypothetical protein
LTPAFSLPSSSPGASSALGHLPLFHLGWSFWAKEKEGWRMHKHRKKEVSNLEAKEHLDAEDARMFCAAGLPLELVRNPYYKRSYIYFHYSL